MAEGHDQHIRKVPITFDGFEVGSGFVNSDGYVTVIRLNDSPVAQEIRSRMKAQPSSISINPRK